MYPNLKAEMARNDVDIQAIMDVTGKSRAAVSNNLNGRGSFSIGEAIKIKNTLFPMFTIDYLFSLEPIENVQSCI